MPSIETAQLGVSIDETSTGPILRSAGLNNLHTRAGTRTDRLVQFSNDPPQREAVTKRMTSEIPPSLRSADLKQAARSFIYSHRAVRYCWIKVRQIQGLIRFPLSWMKGWLFDTWNGIESRTEQSLDGLTIKGPHSLEATGYGALGPKIFFHALSSLRINFSDYAFIDFGSGKGQAVLLASCLPFKRAIGVEFAKELHDIALSNARSWRRKRICGRVEFVWADVLEFEIPQEPCVMYLYHPFSEFILRGVLENILRSIALFQRDLIIVYVNPAYEQAILSLPNVEPISRSLKHAYCAYRILPSSPSN
jgi:hypothetical protein